MNIYPDKKTFLELAKRGNIVPLYATILADFHTPVSAFKKIAQGAKHSFLLESVQGGEKWARYTFMGANPELVIRTSGKAGLRIEGNKKKKFTVSGDPLDEIKAVLAGMNAVQLEGMPPFTGGAVGTIGYDCIRFFEKLPEMAAKDTDYPDTCFMIADSLVVFDNIKQSITVIVNAKVGVNPATAYAKAVAKLGALMKKLESPAKPPKQHRLKGDAKVKGNTTEAAYIKAVDRCKQYIKEGDIFQVVLAQRFTIDIDIPAFDIYRALRVVNPSPYMYYIKMDDWEVVGASPEVLSRLQGGKVTVRPIAGTRKRGATEAEDKALEADLLGDKKELAEHIMLVDLGRNDVGRISKGGSVKVTDLKVIERYSHVMHIVSNVEGELKEGSDAFDVLRATFPAGTLSGAPKIRAMEIIEELEPVRRGCYGGAVGYIAFNGNMDTAIAIRTLAVKGRKGYLGAGAGIVADSDPAAEYQECVNKSKAVLKAIGLARGR